MEQANAEERALMEADEENVGGVVNDEPPLPLNAYVSSWMEKCDEIVDPPPVETPVDATKPDVNPAVRLNSVENPQEERNEVKVEEPPAEALNDTSPAIKQPVDARNWHNASPFQPVYYPPHPMAYMQHMESLLAQQEQYTLTLMPPQPELPVFGGDPIEYCGFIRAFESIIESRTQISSSRLYYLVQYASDAVNELMRSCLTMNAADGY